MSISYTISETTTFTQTHAKHMAAKVAADLKRLQRFYNYPDDSLIANCEIEVIELLKRGYLGTLTVGFKRDNSWIEPTLRYTAHCLASATIVDNDPGRVKPGADVSGASFYNFLTYSTAWNDLSSVEQDTFKKGLPFYRTNAAEPTINGYFVDDRVYSSGGRSLSRASVRSYG